MLPFSDLSIALAIFAVSYGLIITERIHKTIVALGGATLMIVSGVVTQDEAFYSHEFGVDYNVVFLLIGMMVIVNIVRDTGLFEVLAIWSAQRADAHPFRMLALLAIVTAVLSAMLDNVTTVLLMAPVTLSIAKRLRLDPVPFLIVEAVASNIGGTATLVGDPPNIMIASKAELGYLQFLIFLGPVVLVIMAVFLVGLRLFYGAGMQVAPHLKEALLGLEPRDAVQDPLLLRRCVWLLGVVNLAFGFHGVLHLEPATIALVGASAFMLIGRANSQARRRRIVLSGGRGMENHFFLHRLIHSGRRLGKSRRDREARCPVAVVHAGTSGGVGVLDPMGFRISLRRHR